MLRRLTVAQHSRLDRLAIEDPQARVIGWDDRQGGPTVLRDSGREQTITPMGRLVAHRAFSAIANL